MKRPSALQLEQISGDRYPALETAQRAALKETAGDIVETVRRLLADGWLIECNGRIIPNPERCQRE